MDIQKVKGYISRITYRNPDNGYTVMTLDVGEGDEVCCVGICSSFDEGEYVEVEGEESFHPQYGDQIKISRIEAIEPTESKDMERYLASGAISGVGPTLAARIVKKFGDDTFRIMEEEPERLAEIKGISERIAQNIGMQFAEKHEVRSAMLFLQKLNITGRTAMKIYTYYGHNMYRIIRENPYRLAEDISGIGFKIADEIAMQQGGAIDDEFRIKAALYYSLNLASGNGHVYLPEEELYKKTRELVDTDDENMSRELYKLALERKIIVKEEEGERGVFRKVYISSFYYMELNVARMLCDLNCRYEISDEKIKERLQGVIKDLDIDPDELQESAVYEAVKNGVFILTGGPGTGKTTTINMIIRFFEREGMDVLLAAPTGRAAKRMSETTGKEARTIHRLLEIQRLPDDAGDLKGLDFARDESNPLEADAIIIDETSMVDITLMYALLKAITVGTRVIFVGDENQLPSVGPGNVLKDIIASGAFNTVLLQKIFRQAAESDIIVNAHKINRGERIELVNKQGSDFFFLNRRDAAEIADGIIYLVKQKLSGFLKVDPKEIQVLTPMRAGMLGCEGLNLRLQEALNPAAPNKHEHQFEGEKILREGDKVMQIKNDYQLEWEVRSRHGVVIDSGTGVFNGDCGTIKNVDKYAQTITVEFEEGREVRYQFSQCDELQLSYAVTIHKSQGSEYPAVVLPLLTGPRMLFNRNVLYTGVTRAKRCVTIIGASDTVDMMIDNVMEQTRYSGLCQAIRDCM